MTISKRLATIVVNVDNLANIDLRYGGTVNRNRVMLGDVDPTLWAKVKAEAALARKPISQWVSDVLAEAVEDAEDVRISMERMNDSEGTVSYEEAEEMLNNARSVPIGLPKKGVRRAGKASPSRPAARPAPHRRVAV